MPEKSRKLYERCWGCEGTRILKRSAMVDGMRTVVGGKSHTYSGPLKPGGPCPLCTDGYYEIGLTLGQVEGKLTTLDEFTLALADFFGSFQDTYGDDGPLDAAYGQAAELLQKHAARVGSAVQAAIGVMCTCTRTPQTSSQARSGESRSVTATTG
jgi:hypothetical protein